LNTQSSQGAAIPKPWLTKPPYLHNTITAAPKLQDYCAVSSLQVFFEMKSRLVSLADEQEERPNLE